MPLPLERICIPSGWNFKIKTGKDSLPKRRKARFFAKDYRQVKGIDYQESFAPVVRYVHIKPGRKRRNGLLTLSRSSGEHHVCGNHCET
jgi:hypothetical protein